MSIGEMPVPNKLRLSDEELASGEIFIKSDVWQAKGGVVWEVVHPPSGWKDSGTTTNMLAGTQAAEASFAKAMTDAGYHLDESGTVTLLRIRDDG